MLQGHPDRRTPGVEVASGSLGQGLSVPVGMSLAAKIDKKITVFIVLWVTAKFRKEISGKRQWQPAIINAIIYALYWIIMVFRLTEK